MSAWSVELRGTVGSRTLDVSLRADGGVLALVGPNGSGKTSVLRAIVGALAMTHARIDVAGMALHERPIEARKVAYVPQGGGLFPHLDVRRNVAFGAEASRADTLLEQLGLRELASRAVGRLSGGERQRVALARALALDPALLLLDEPLSALDATARRSVRTMLAEHLRAWGGPAILVTHAVADVRALHADVAVLEAGRIVQQGSVEALCAAPATPFVDAFVTG
ncbi:MAG: ATP-binding cassette domain-containing protein [Myxococcota bacterium]